MPPQRKKTFEGMTFYFDLKFYRKQDELSKNIKRLGGKIDFFLDKNVSHLITDRPLKCNSTNFTSDFSFSTTSRSYDSGFASRRSTWSQILYSHSPPVNQGSANVFDICKQWCIKIVTLQKLLEFISRYKTYVKKTQEIKTSKMEISSKAECSQEILNSPFIKIEDKKCNSRPFYRVFKSWHDCFKPAQQIFDKIQKDMRKKNRVLKPSQVSNIPNRVLTPKFASPRDGLGNVHIFPKVCKLNALHMVKDKVKKTMEKKVAGMKRFCEVCNMSYLYLKEHLSTPKHKLFMCDSKNFKTVKEVNRSLPTVEDFLKKAVL